MRVGADYPPLYTKESLPQNSDGDIQRGDINHTLLLRNEYCTGDQRRPLNSLRVVPSACCRWRTALEPWGPSMPGTSSASGRSGYCAAVCALAQPANDNEVRGEQTRANEHPCPTNELGLWHLGLRKARDMCWEH